MRATSVTRSFVFHRTRHQVLNNEMELMGGEPNSIKSKCAYIRKMCNRTFVLSRYFCPPSVATDGTLLSHKFPDISSITVRTVLKITSLVCPSVNRIASK